MALPMVILAACTGLACFHFFATRPVVSGGLVRSVRFLRHFMSRVSANFSRVIFNMFSFFGKGQATGSLVGM